jgi:hypothetical protein
VTLLNQTIELVKPGQITTLKTEIPFQVQLKNRFGKPLYETYHGVFVNIQVKFDILSLIKSHCFFLFVN